MTFSQEQITLGFDALAGNVAGVEFFNKTWLPNHMQALFSTYQLQDAVFYWGEIKKYMKIPEPAP